MGGFAWFHGCGCIPRGAGYQRAMIIGRGCPIGVLTTGFELIVMAREDEPLIAM
ncbi:MAG: hypothetical protein HQ502_02320 [Alphaproteobacteria bacterium]|nr:hypothetical protein [Alphaproteobacteria bacterium]